MKATEVQKEGDTYIGIFDITKARHQSWFMTGSSEERVRQWAEMFPNLIIFFVNINQEV